LLYVAAQWETFTSGLVVAFTYVNNGTTIFPFHVAALFYHGSSLPPHIFSSFLAIPATSQFLAPQSYSSVSAAIGSGNNSGFGELYGASALNGPPEDYINAFRHYKNLSMSILPSGKVALSILGFTPIPESQVLAGRRKGGNAIHPPLGSYAAVQLTTQFAQGVKEVPPEVEEGRLLFFEQ
jgi:hypothetical protein